MFCCWITAPVASVFEVQRDRTSSQGVRQEPFQNYLSILWGWCHLSKWRSTNSQCQLFILYFAKDFAVIYICPIPKQSAVHTGQIKVPPGYHPIDVEKEWGRLHVAILERERLLRTEFERWVIPWTLCKHCMSNCSPHATCADVSFAAFLDNFTSV